MIMTIARCGIKLENRSKLLRRVQNRLKSLRDNETFTLTNLPEGKKTVGGRWVNAIKKNIDGSDNQGAIVLAKNPVNRQRCKHVDIKNHFVRSTLNDGKISLNY